MFCFLSLHFYGQFIKMNYYLKMFTFFELCSRKKWLLFVTNTMRSMRQDVETRENHLFWVEIVNFFSQWFLFRIWISLLDECLTIQRVIQMKKKKDHVLLLNNLILIEYLFRWKESWLLSHRQLISTHIPFESRQWVKKRQKNHAKLIEWKINNNTKHHQSVSLSLYFFRRSSTMPKWKIIHMKIVIFSLSNIILFTLSFLLILFIQFYLVITLEAKLFLIVVSRIVSKRKYIKLIKNAKKTVLMKMNHVYRNCNAVLTVF